MEEARKEKIRAYMNIIKTCIQPIKEMINIENEEGIKEYSMLCMEVITELVKK